METTGKLKKSIGLPQAVALYIGAVLGSGVLLVPGLAAEIAGPASLLAWAIMAVLVLPMALVMGLLSARFPNAGGVAYFVSRAFHPKTGSLIGWFFLMAVPIGAPVAALTGAGYMAAAFGLSRGAVIATAAIMLGCALLVNFLGMKVAGMVQVAVVAAIASVLLTAVVGAVPSIEKAHFVPFMPHGWASVGQAAALLFWCFIGWEAVSHLSEEFVDPQREAVKGVSVAAVIVGLLYFFTAFATVGTGSYGAFASSVSLVLIIERLFGTSGAIVVGITGIFICTATIIAYIGAASRLAYALAKEGMAPEWFSRLSARQGTPVGGLLFLAACFALVLTLYSTEIISLKTLIQLPNATFILTYLGGCAAGIRLLRDSRLGMGISWLSFLLTAAVFPFTGWSMLYPLTIAVFCWLSWHFQKKIQVKPEDKRNSEKSSCSQ
ncbi:MULTISPECIES: amino acid permease [Aneurinibacillus]|uniref:Amino acid permease n=1 Tax=Aneurinibacillus thermoaerophilus TaxID=143495 RepID=A0ABX8YAR0_ANETH|nr:MULTISPECIES: amino acid permease [Aneurinibacillus]AMA72023.1 amino acid permease [Aneurinibacillus sp. XH2]MED0679306.1 amino acid permease [Aneurinibacillus thermoaerophilus]MED0737192.1 amino acid permease [Aneurinibacillus thermoaerophilus]MED0764755.1 amino acid permease [Aneurinibacillus thermoaerophilus]QYY42204.1 amino acid permease [Aneurinibacillus thermoaerophilus]